MLDSDDIAAFPDVTANKASRVLCTLGQDHNMAGALRPDKTASQVVPNTTRNIGKDESIVYDFNTRTGYCKLSSGLCATIC